MAAIDLTFGTQLSIDYGTKRGTGKRTSNRSTDKIAKFIRSYELGMFCDFNVLPETGSLIQIAVSRENGAYPIDKDGNYVCDFLINRDGEGDKNFKAKRFITKPSIGEKEIFHAETYFVWKTQTGRWAAFRVLNDEDQLSRNKVAAAVEAYADLKGYTVISKPVVVENGAAKYWKTVCTDGDAKREIFVNFDNGKMRDCPFGSFETQVKNVPEYGILKTKFNFFRYLGSGIFSRN